MTEAQLFLANNILKKSETAIRQKRSKTIHENQQLLMTALLQNHKLINASFLKNHFTRQLPKNFTRQLPHSRVKKSSYKTESYKMTSHLELLTQTFFRNFSFELLTRLHKILN